MRQDGGDARERDGREKVRKENRPILRLQSWNSGLGSASICFVRDRDRDRVVSRLVSPSSVSSLLVS